jgi:hypothetical protein
VAVAEQAAVSKEAEMHRDHLGGVQAFDSKVICDSIIFYILSMSDMSSNATGLHNL